MWYNSSMDEIAQIAVVEDDATIRAILEMALMGAGFVHVGRVGFAISFR